jgi:hypothetical protein
MIWMKLRTVCDLMEMTLEMNDSNHICVQLFSSLQGNLLFFRNLPKITLEMNVSKDSSIELLSTI